jgi:hypothetical protein
MEERLSLKTFGNSRGRRDMIHTAHACGILVSTGAPSITPSVVAVAPGLAAANRAGAWNMSQVTAEIGLIFMIFKPISA